MNKYFKIIKENIKKSLVMLLFLTIGMQIFVVNTYASGGINSITAPIKNLTLLLEAIVAAVGVIIIVYNVMHLGPAIGQQDSSGISTAARGIVGGVVMFMVGTVLAIMGIA